MNCSFNRNECFITATKLLSLLVVLTIAGVNGFSSSSSKTFGIDSIICRQQQPQQQYQRPMWLNMVTDGNNNNNNNEENVAAEESMDDVQEITNNVDDQQQSQSQSEEVGVENDETIDEITQIKDEISKLENDIKNKRRTLAYYNDMADDFTKSGYARKVAEMENMRRARTMLVSSNKYSATAVTLSEFLPVYDTLNTLRNNYGEDEFGKQYGAVTGGMKGAFTTLGTTEYSINIGEKVDTNRVTVLESLYSSTIPKNHVIQVLSNGMELNGNIIRPAECVISLGEEVFDDEEEEIEIATTTTTTVASAAEDEQANAESQQEQGETATPPSDGSSN